MKNQYSHPNELKIKAIEMVIGLGIPKYKTAEILGVSSHTVICWVRLYEGNENLAMKVRQSKINTPEIVGNKGKRKLTNF
ncbi:hypothetical protein [Sphingobacterium faecium]